MNNKIKTSVKIWATISVSVVAAIIIIFITHKYDNKYTYPGVQGFSGVLDLEEQMPLGNEVQFLIDGWEFYQYKLLEPVNFVDHQIIPDAYTFIGQYPGFEMGNIQNSPHGSGTYRIKILIDDVRRQYMLELPEIFSAYKIYINGTMMYKSGNSDPNDYIPEIINTTITFEAESEIEIIIAATDYDHYYSGMYYPPGFGTPQAINQMLTTRIIIKSIQCFFALSIFISYIFIFMMNKKDNIKLYFAMMCLAYTGYNLYPITHSIVSANSFILYRIEDLSFYAMLYFISMIQLEICPFKNKKMMKKVITVISVGIMASSVIIPQFFIESNLKINFVYSTVVDAYKFLLFIFLIISSCVSAYKRVLSSKIILSGNIIFAMGIFADTFSYGYEPVLCGWGSEISGFILICIFAVMMIQRGIKLEKENEELSYEHKNTEKYISDMAHDLKAPVAAISGYVELIREGIAEKTGKKDEYLNSIEEKSNQLKMRINKLQSLELSKISSLNKTRIQSVEFINSIEDKYKEIMEEKKIQFKLKSEDFAMCLDEEKILIIIENTIMNALRYTEPGGCISVEIFERDENIVIKIADTGIGIDKENIDKIFQRHYTTDISHSGIGLDICLQLAKIHGGNITVKSEINKGSEFTITIH